MNDITESMEKWSSLVLTLFHPFRSDTNLHVPGQSHGYICKLCKLYAEDECQLRRKQKPELFMEHNMKFLQNIQDFWWNSLQYKPKPNDLQLVTEPYVQVDDDGVPVDDRTKRRTMRKSKILRRTVMKICCKVLL
jgi:hypothetical protein